MWEHHQENPEKKCGGTRVLVPGHQNSGAPYLPDWQTFAGADRGKWCCRQVQHDPEVLSGHFCKICFYNLFFSRYCRGTFTKSYKKTIGVDFLEKQLRVQSEEVTNSKWSLSFNEMRWGLKQYVGHCQFHIYGSRHPRCASCYGTRPARRSLTPSPSLTTGELRWRSDQGQTSWRCWSLFSSLGTDITDMTRNQINDTFLFQNRVKVKVVGEVSEKWN